MTPNDDRVSPRECGENQRGCRKEVFGVLENNKNSIEGKIKDLDGKVEILQCSVHAQHLVVMGAISTLEKKDTYRNGYTAGANETGKHDGVGDDSLTFNKWMMNQLRAMVGRGVQMLIIMMVIAALLIVLRPWLDKYWGGGDTKNSSSIPVD